VTDGAGCEWVLVTGPTAEPLSVAEAKLQARIRIDDEDALIDRYIKAARSTAEETLGRGLLTQTWKLTLPSFAESIWLPMAAPLQSVTSVKYYDTTGTLLTLSATVYTVDLVSRPGRLVRAPLQSWPSLQSDRLTGKVEITYVVGWTDKALIPERIVQGMRLYLGYLDSDREGLDELGELARTAADACWTDRVCWKPPACAA
jgi:uncharacterized phiE125 gp8 family phage protein